MLSLEMSLPGDTVSQRNISEENIAEAIGEYIDSYAQINLLSTLGDAEYRRSKKGKELYLGFDKIEKRLSGDTPDFERAIEALDKKKSYILSPDEPFLIKLGISSADGRIHDKKQGKYRQINRFLEYFNQVYDNLPHEGVLTVYAPCSGKSYLSFALYHHLTVNHGREVRLLAIDLKEDVIRSCGGDARGVGFDGMHFVCDDVRNTPKDITPDLVISLHACDVATDIVLECAMNLSARLILSTPCCHRELSRHIKSAPLAFVTKYGKLRDKLAEALTDGLRLLRLESEGYKVAALELTDPDDTPKNTLLLAHLVGEKNEKKREEYESALSYLLGEKKDEYLR
jgi:hypothetical protein